jgi:hypothetical protein
VPTSVFHLFGDLGLFPGVVLVLRVAIAMRDRMGRLRMPVNQAGPPRPTAMMKLLGGGGRDARQGALEN